MWAVVEEMRDSREQSMKLPSKCEQPEQKSNTNNDYGIFQGDCPIEERQIMTLGEEG